MTPERWQQIDQLLEAALELEPSQWTAFLDQNCEGDHALQREVASLLAAHKQSGSFIEGPPAQAAAELLAVDPMESFVGQQIGRYKILELLGKGGMGEVYSVWDTRLGRKVALKLLPSHFAHDKDRLRRFEQEAHAASALNHPNILTIHEIEQVDGRPSIVTEFIDGVTLREQMTHIQMNVVEKLDVTIQVASALSAAHEAGIVHRDIKPENIMRRRDGYIKVLDFGIAKLVERPKRGGDINPAGTTRTMIKTDTGIVVGTATYMSPEQTRGQKVDARADIWSLGVVLYEMVAGRVPFEGKDIHRQIIAIQEQEPLALSRFEGAVPERLEEIVQKALAKDVDRRYQTTKDLLIDLRDLKRKLEVDEEIDRSVAPGVSGGTRAATRNGATAAERAAPGDSGRKTSSAEYLVSEIKRHKRGATLIAAIFVIAIVGIAFGLYRFIARNQSKAERAAPFQSMKQIRLTTSGNVSAAAISRDGKYVAYSKYDGKQQSLWIKQVETSGEVQLVQPAEAWYSGLQFSNDGDYLYYRKAKSWKAENNRIEIPALYRIPVIGGTPNKVLVNINTKVTFSPDGKQLAFVRSMENETALTLANVDGSGERILAALKRPEFYFTPAWSPDGKTIACVLVSSDVINSTASVVEVRIADGTERSITSHKWGFVDDIWWTGDGSGLVISAKDGWPNPSQISKIAYPNGEVTRVTNDLNDYKNVSLTSDSAALATVQRVGKSNIWIVPEGDSSRAKQIAAGSGYDGDHMGFSWTPDGKILYVSSASGNQNIWMMDADGRNQRQLTADADGNFDPSVTPDGHYVVFTSTRSGRLNIWRMDIDGSNPKQLTNGVADFVPYCAPDGRWVVYTAGDPDRFTLWKVSIDGDNPIQVTDVNCHWPAVSPDGKLIACWHSDEKVQLMKLAVFPCEGGQPLKAFDITPSARTWGEVRWTPDSQALTYVDDGAGVSNVWSQSLNGGSPKQLTDFRSEEMRSIIRFAWSRDGKQLVCSRASGTSDVVLIKDFR